MSSPALSDFIGVTDTARAHIHKITQRTGTTGGREGRGGGGEQTQRGEERREQTQQGGEEREGAAESRHNKRKREGGGGGERADTTGGREGERRGLSGEQTQEPSPESPPRICTVDKSLFTNSRSACRAQQPDTQTHPQTHREKTLTLSLLLLSGRIHLPYAQSVSSDILLAATLSSCCCWCVACVCMCMLLYVCVFARVRDADGA